jgi:hypothetical protein
MLSHRKETIFFCKKASFIFFFVNLRRFYTIVAIFIQKNKFL